MYDKSRAIFVNILYIESYLLMVAPKLCLSAQSEFGSAHFSLHITMA